MVLWNIICHTLWQTGTNILKKTIIFHLRSTAVSHVEKNYKDIGKVVWLGWCNWYSDMLQAGQSGDRNPVMARFFHASILAPRPTQPPVQWVPGLSQGYGGQSVMLTTHTLLVMDCRQVQDMISPPLCLHKDFMGVTFTLEWKARVRQGHDSTNRKQFSWKGLLL
jgi:hypothetical protein